MALNPPLTYDGLPLKVSGEVFVLSRQHMEIEVKIKNNNEFGKKTGKGMVMNFKNIIINIIFY